MQRLFWEHRSKTMTRMSHADGVFSVRDIILGIGVRSVRVKQYVHVLEQAIAIIRVLRDPLSREAVAEELADNFERELRK